MKEFEVEICAWGNATESDGLDSGDFSGSWEYDEETESYIFEGTFTVTVKAETEIEAKDFAELEYEKADCGTLWSVGHDDPEIKGVKELSERNRGSERE